MFRSDAPSAAERRRRARRRRGHGQQPAVAPRWRCCGGNVPGHDRYGSWLLSSALRALLPCTPTALTAYNWRARVMCAGWIGSGVVVEFARAYDAGLRAWLVSIGQHRASRREADQRPREARFCRPHRGRVRVRWASGLVIERAGGQKRRRRPDFGSYSTYLVPKPI